LQAFRLQGDAIGLTWQPLPHTAFICFIRADGTDQAATLCPDRRLFMSSSYAQCCRVSRGRADDFPCKGPPEQLALGPKTIGDAML
jgi:hypothetical protein